MAVESTPRFTLPRWTMGTDPYPGRVGWNNILALLDDQAAIAFPSGPISSRPKSGAFGRFFLATDQGDGGRLYYDGGSGWIELNTNGGGGPGTAVVIEGSGAEGNSNRSARADHSHAIPLATAVKHGAMSSQHYALLDTATTGAVARALVRRTTSGDIALPAVPTGQYDATSKDWVQNVVGTSSLINNTLVRRFSNGCFRAGLASHIDDVVTIRYIDSVSDSYIGGGGNLMRRWSNGVGANVEDPDQGWATANRRYVDSRTSREAWKENLRPLDYGLAELRPVNTLVFDYREDESTPLSVRGTKDVHGALVEQIAELMPRLAEDGEDGAPERIKDRELIWPVIRAVQELAEENDTLRGENQALQSRVSRIEGYLGL